LAQGVHEPVHAWLLSLSRERSWLACHVFASSLQLSASTPSPFSISPQD
jgi:hypothetical protein